MEPTGRGGAGVATSWNTLPVSPTGTSACQLSSPQPSPNRPFNLTHSGAQRDAAVARARRRPGAVRLSAVDFLVETRRLERQAARRMREQPRPHFGRRSPSRLRRLASGLQSRPPRSRLQDRTPAAVDALWVDSREARESTAARNDRIETEIAARPRKRPQAHSQS